MKINEIFASLQGEGIYRGKPSIFIRFSGCNLNCVYCDTPYANDYDRTITFRRIINFMKKSRNINHIVFTGGEPMLQQESIVRILNYFSHYTFEIETNGTQVMSNDIKKKLLSNDYSFINVSPKMSNSGNDEKLCKVDYEEYKQFSNFKFVVDSMEDFEEVVKIVEKNNIDKEYVYIMPQCLTRTKMMRMFNFIQPCIKYGFTFCDRGQILWKIR